MSCFRLIDAEKANYPVSVLCKMLKVSRSGYYDWKDRPPSKQSRKTYGSPRVHAELSAIGIRCGRKQRMARLMSKEGVSGCIRGRRKRTTRRGKRAVPAEDLVSRRRFPSRQAAKTAIFEYLELLQPHEDPFLTRLQEPRRL